jgi:type IV pilus assembly protein PilB
MKNYEQKIKDYLIKKGLVTEAKLDLIMAKIETPNLPLEKILVDEKLIKEEELLQIKSEIFNLPAISLEDAEVFQEVINLMPQKVAENYQAVIFERQNNIIKIGLVNPGDFLAHEAVDFLAKGQGLKAQYFVISYSDFNRFLSKYGETRELKKALASAQEKFEVKEKKGEKATAQSLEAMIKAAPVAKIASVVVKNAVEGKASDIHIEPGRKESRIRYRVDGMLHTSLTLPHYLHMALVSRIKVLANLKLDETRIPQDGRIRMEFDGRDVDLRVSVLPMLNSEKVVIRVLDTSAGIPTLEELGFSDYHIEILKRSISKPFGVMLLTGPTGSGKTTTLYSILNMIKTETSNITTLEDPIEYYVAGVNQSQINTEVGFSFASGLRALLRQDPNVIMVGEIRDTETAELVVHAGLTGHMVFSTLHTNSAWGGIPRLIDMKVEPFLLSSTLNLVIAQRLVRKICPDCKREEKLPPALLEKVKNEIKAIPDEYLGTAGDNLKFYHGAGCEECNNSGYIGRTIIGEMLEIGTEMRDIISKEDFSSEIVKEQLKKQKYVTLFQDGLVKAVKGLTSIDEIMRVTQM